MNLSLVLVQPQIELVIVLSYNCEDYTQQANDVDYCKEEQRYGDPMIKLIAIDEHTTEHGHGTDYCAEGIHIPHNGNSIWSHVVLQDSIEADYPAYQCSLNTDLHCILIQDEHDQKLHVHFDELPIIELVLVLTVHETILELNVYCIKSMGISAKPI